MFFKVTGEKKTVFSHYMHVHVIYISLLFSGCRHVINNVKTTHYITLATGRSKVLTTSVTILKSIKISFERSYDKQNIT